MREDTTQILIVCTTFTIIFTSLFCFIWDYNKTELITFDETQTGYRECLEECNFVSGNNGKTNLDEVQCFKGCYGFYYNKDANCTKDEEVKV